MKPVDPRIDPTLLPVFVLTTVQNACDRVENLPSVLTLTLTQPPKVISRWELTPEERMRIFAGEDIYVTTISVPINPFYLTVGTVDWREEK